MVDNSSRNRQGQLASLTKGTQQTLLTIDESYSEYPHKPRQMTQSNNFRILPRKSSEQILKTIQNKMNTGHTSASKENHSAKRLSQQVSCQNLTQRLQPDSSTYYEQSSIKKERNQSSERSLSCKKKPMISHPYLMSSKFSTGAKGGRYSQRQAALGKLAQEELGYKEKLHIQKEMQLAVNSRLQEEECSGSEYLQGVKVDIQVPLETQKPLSPKDYLLPSNLFSSPRLSSGYQSQKLKNATKSISQLKLQIYHKNQMHKKASQNVQLTEVAESENLSKAEHKNFFLSNNPQQMHSQRGLPSSNQTINDSKDITLQYRSNSPSGNISKHYKRQSAQSSLRKIHSQSNLHFLQNLSIEGRLTLNGRPKMAAVQEELPSMKGKQGGGQGGRFYSPKAAITINKALSRISSVNEFKKMKQQLANERKSIENSKMGKSNSDRKNSQFHNKLASTQKQTREEDDSEEYLTEQEKLWIAISSGASKEVIRDKILSGKKISVNEKNIFEENWTCLHYAIQEGSYEVFHMLIEEFGADIDPRTTYNKTPLHFACRRGETRFIEFLLKKGANPQVVDRDGCTPLHYLCENENLEMIKLCLAGQSGGAVEVRNRFGKKPIDMIASQSMKKLVRQYFKRRQPSTSNNIKQTSASRERSPQTLPSTLIVQKLSDDKYSADAINQMFRKFNNYRKNSRDYYHCGEASTRYERPGSSSQKAVQSPLSSDRSLEREKFHQAKRETLEKGALAKRQTLETTKHAKGNSYGGLGLGSPKGKVPAKKGKTGTKVAQPKIMFGVGQQKGKNTQQVYGVIKNDQNYGKGSISSEGKGVALPNSMNSSHNQSQSSKKLTHVSSQGALHSKASCKKQQRIFNLTKQIDEVIKARQDEKAKTAKVAAAQTKQAFPYSPQQQQQQESSQSQKTSGAFERTMGGGGNLDMIRENDSLEEMMQAKEEEFEMEDTGEEQVCSAANDFCDEKVVVDNKASVEQSTFISSNNAPKDSKVGPWSFIAHQLLGTGSFGEVYLVEKVSSGHFFAMKVLTKSKILGHNLSRYALTERNVLSIQRHPFIVGLHFAFQTQEKLYMVLDYCPGGDLAEYLQLEKKFNEEKTKIYACEILLALEELHRKDIIFRDLKPDNVVLDEEGHALLTDFGLSKEGVQREGMAKSFCGSYAYLAPEMLRKTGHGKAVDWYLFGVVIYEMLTGTPPYYANNKEELFQNIKHQQLQVPAHISAAAKDLITRLLNRNSKKRLGTMGGAEEIKKHPFFQDIEWDKVFNREYIPPQPYLKKRFENFLAMPPEMRTNTEVYEELRRQGIQKTLFKNSGQPDQNHLQGWTFVSPSPVPQPK